MPILNVGTAPGDFTTIQAAVNAAVNGDTIQIAAGTYREQVTINGKDLTVHGAGDGAGGTIIESPDAAALVVNATDPNAARPNKFAVVAVTGGANVTIDGLAVDGRRQGFQNRADYDFVGVYVLNSDAVINGVAVSNIVSDQLPGAQRNSSPAPSVTLRSSRPATTSPMAAMVPIPSRSSIPPSAISRRKASWSTERR